MSGRVPRRLEGRVKPENRLRLRWPRNGGPLVFSGVQSFLWTFHRETKHLGARHPSRCSGPSAASPAVFVPCHVIEAAIGAARSSRRPLMATIGNFTKSGDRYTGAVRTLTLNVKAQIAPAEKENDKAPDYRVFCRGRSSSAQGGKRPPAPAASTSRSSSTIRAFRLPSTPPSSKPKARVSSPSSGPAARPSDQASNRAPPARRGALFWRGLSCMRQSPFSFEAAGLNSKTTSHNRVTHTG